MSETETDQHQCAICGQFVSDTEVENHLRDNHSDAKDKIKDVYGERTVERVFDTGEDQELGLVIEGSRECSICGEIVEPEDGEDKLSIGRAGLHLSKEHPDTDKSVYDVFGDLEVSNDKPSSDESEATTESDSDIDATSQEVSFGATTSDNTETEQAGGTENVDNIANSADSSPPKERSRERGKTSSSSSGFSSREEATTRGKFSVFGIGGAGNNILDAMLMRRDTLRNQNSRLAKAWEGGLQTYVPLNTNDSEISGTYYDLEDNPDTRPSDIMQRGRIGDGSGAGEDPEIGLLRMQSDIDKAPEETIRSWPFTTADLRAAQAHMFVHSVVKGTGSGATPFLAQYIREDILEETREQKDRTPMMAVTILPNEKATKYNPAATINAGFGVGMMASNVDVLIPFDNERLGEAGRDISPEIDGLNQANPTYAQANRPLVQFLEAFMLSSNKEMRDTDATAELASSAGLANGSGSDDGFDVPDSYQPIQNRYPLREDNEIRPGTVACPMIAVSESSRGIDETGLGILIETALNKGLLVNCNPETAWGGAFMFYGPEDPMQDIARHVRNYVPHEKIENVLGTDELRTNFHQAVVPEADKLYMWGLLWNPKMPAMEQMWVNTKEARQRNNDQGRLLRENWDEIKPVYQYLGRENRE